MTWVNMTWDVGYAVFELEEGRNKGREEENLKICTTKMVNKKGNSGDY